MPAAIASLTLSDARLLIAAAEVKAREIGVAYNLAVVDAGNNLVAFVRMDGAWLGSIDIAVHKASTARAFDMTTAALGKMATPRKPLFGIQNTNDDGIVIFGGGAPVMQDGVVIGAFGASGGTVDQDVEVMQAALDAFE